MSPARTKKGIARRGNESIPFRSLAAIRWSGTSPMTINPANEHRPIEKAMGTPAKRVMAKMTPIIRKSTV
jgi:hypothetical protein